MVIEVVAVVVVVVVLVLVLVFIVVLLRGVAVIYVDLAAHPPFDFALESCRPSIDTTTQHNIRTTTRQQQRNRT